MSLNRLLSFVPLARRLGSAVNRRVSSGAFLVFLSFNLLTAVWGLMLLVSLAVFFAFAWFTPRVAYFDSISARDAEIASINSLTGVDVLQRKAVFDVLKGYDNGATATFLCHIALGTLLFMIIGSTAGLLLVRWIKRHLGTIEDENR
ncbi:MAG TPA: hypothetical protein VN784_13795 [Candidatus Limnocylindrales bacterium]|nr:hypothetical protein [Candidatus Limnocylindrales bacterium]